MQPSRLVLAMLMTLSVTALLQPAAAEENYYEGCAASGASEYSCRGVTRPPNPGPGGRTLCYTEWTSTDRDADPYETGDTIVTQYCV